MSQINVEVNVDETSINIVQVGQEAKVKVDALGDKEIKAVVTQKNPLAISRSDLTGGLSNRVNVQEAKEFKVTLELRDLPEDVQISLRPGMSSTATITTNTKNNVLAVPLESIVEKAPTPSASPSATIAGSVASASSGGEKPKAQKGVYLIEGNKVRFIEVTTGITGEADIEITSGLNAKQEIVRGPSRVLKTLKDGMTVKRQTRKPGTPNNEAT
jgi:HlyD family secretion protein